MVLAIFNPKRWNLEFYGERISKKLGDSEFWDDGIWKLCSNLLFDQNKGKLLSSPPPPKNDIETLLKFKI